MLEERGDKHAADSTLDKHVGDADGLASASAAVTSAARRCEKFKDKLDLFLVGLFLFWGGGCLLSVFLSNSSSRLLRGTSLIKNVGCSQEI